MPEKVAYTVERGAGLDRSTGGGVPEGVGVDTREGSGFTDMPQDVVDGRDGQSPRGFSEGQEERFPCPSSHPHRPFVGAQGGCPSKIFHLPSTEDVGARFRGLISQDRDLAKCRQRVDEASRRGKIADFWLGRSIKTEPGTNPVVHETVSRYAAFRVYL